MQKGNKNTVYQQKKQRRGENLIKYRFKKGISGNIKGRPPGKSLKTFAREYLESLPEEEKLAYLRTMPTEIVWKMAEGNPKQDTDVTSGGEAIQPILVKFINGKSENNRNSGRVSEVV